MTSAMRFGFIIIAAIFMGVAVFLWAEGRPVPSDALAQAASPLVTPSSARSRKAIARNTERLSQSLSQKNMSLGDPLFIRIIKTTREQSRKGRLEVFVKRDSGEFSLFKSYDICTWSGQLGPKLKQGDGQSPEGFYFVRPAQMNPNSSYHLSFNLGYPNAYDRTHGRTGDFLMVHGACASIGCYAMTDAVIEEIYTLMAAAFENGQPFVRTHIFPFPMTDDALAGHSGNKNAEFWRNLKQGWDWFETHNEPPNVTVSSGVYAFGAITP